jgi:predicted glycosyltransferase
MLRNSVYYRLKPVLPRSLRIFMRRRFAARLRSRVQALWPVYPGSGRPPVGWSGWPEGRRFAVVLTHDVEGPAGHAKCRELMQREAALGFRSSFNFIPEGDYDVSPDLREELTRNGFEVGVHDLKHDGHLYSSLAGFTVQAAKINQYLREWQARGFRSGFMLQNLDWLHQLSIDYDASTFDTDPFEPQPEGRHTIFPFWNPPPPSSNGDRGSEISGGYVELPYTLPQDSTLFLILRETSISVWKQKLDWIAAHGGMALLNTHPDYMAMSGPGRDGRDFPVGHYEDFLNYIRTAYAGQYWQPLPREVARLIGTRETERRTAEPGVPADGRHGIKRKPRIWIDLDNTPHVPFFAPIIAELESRGYPLLVTARDAFQVCELADQYQLAYFRIGRHHGKNKLAKAAGLLRRASQLTGTVQRDRPALALSHGSRAQLMLAGALRIPSLLVDDYEHSSYPLTMKPDWMLVPDVIPVNSLPVKADRVLTYPGIKEDAYVPSFRPDDSLPAELGIAPGTLLVTARPPATEAHYHAPESESLFAAFMDRALTVPDLTVVLLPRNDRQRRHLETRHPEWFRDRRTIVPARAVDGLNLLWHSDLAVSGGGTMNREAAALGVPVYSVFRGNPGAVDRKLQEEGRLHFISCQEDIARIPLSRRRRSDAPAVPSGITLTAIVDAIEKVAALATRPR